MVMSFTIIYYDIEIEHLNKQGIFAQGMLGVLDMNTKITSPTLLINRIILLEAPSGKKY